MFQSSMIRFSVAALVAGLSIAGLSTASAAPKAKGDKPAQVDKANKGQGNAKGDRGKHKGQRGQHHADRFKRADQNNDGFLTQSEVGDKRWAWISKADQNKDGKVSMAELKAAKEHFKGNRDKHKAERFKRADQNNDGFLTQSEVGDKRWAWISKADQNKDGKVSLTELKAAKKQHKGAGKRRGHHKRQGPQKGGPKQR